MPSRTVYTSVLALAQGFAAASGEPLEVVLRRIGDQAVTNAFLEGSFLNGEGLALSPLVIWQIINGVLHSGGKSRLEVLALIRVSREHAQAFCDRTGTARPRAMAGSRIRRYLRGGPRAVHLVPPECPEGRELAIAAWRRESTLVFIGQLREILDRTSDLSHSDMDAWAHWGQRWAKYREATKNELEMTGDAELMAQLAELEAKWGRRCQAHFDAGSDVAARGLRAENVGSLKRAKSEKINEVIASIYKDKKGAGEKPPNINEIVPLAKAELKVMGYCATNRDIQQVADEPQYRKMRRQPGKTVRSEQRR